MRLSDYVQSKDIDLAIAVTVESFVGAQKVSVKKSMARAFAKYTLPKANPRTMPASAARGTTTTSQGRSQRPQVVN